MSVPFHHSSKVTRCSTSSSIVASQDRVPLSVEPLEARLVLSFTGFSDYEQLMIELLNRDRQNPSEAIFLIDQTLQDSGSTTITNPSQTDQQRLNDWENLIGNFNPRQPLAPHQALLNAAGDYSDEMYDDNRFAHTGSDGRDPFDRMRDAGYTGKGRNENIAVGGWIVRTAGFFGPILDDVTDYDEREIHYRHAQLTASSGHRTAIYRSVSKDIGVGVTFWGPNARDYNIGSTPWGAENDERGVLVTEKFGSSSTHYLTGVVYTDEVIDDDFYSVGEGLGGVTIVAEAQGGGTFSTTTASTGGYSLALANGTYTVTFSGGGISTPIVYNNVAIDGQNVKVDAVPGEVQEPPANPPQVAGVSLAAHTWDDQSPHPNGYAVPTGADQLSSLPWSNLNTIAITFTENVNVSAGDLTVWGVNHSEYSLAAGGFSYDSTTNTATWTLSDVLPADKVMIHLADSVTGATSGLALDGEWSDGADTFNSGDGNAGGHFQFTIHVLPGDVNGNGDVNGGDVIVVRNAQFTSEGDPGYSPMLDSNGDGVINGGDLIKTRNSQFTGLPSGEPSPAGALSAQGASVENVASFVAPIGTLQPLEAVESTVSLGGLFPGESSLGGLTTLATEIPVVSLAQPLQPTQTGFFQSKDSVPSESQDFFLQAANAEDLPAEVLLALEELGVQWWAELLGQAGQNQ